MFAPMIISAFYLLQAILYFIVIWSSAKEGNQTMTFIAAFAFFLCLNMGIDAYHMQVFMTGSQFMHNAIVTVGIWFIYFKYHITKKFTRGKRVLPRTSEEESQSSVTPEQLKQRSF